VDAFDIRRHQPQVVLDAITSQDQPGKTELPARILIMEGNFFVATDIKTAPSEPGFDVGWCHGFRRRRGGTGSPQRPTLVMMDAQLARERDGAHASPDFSNN
jgi:hypothetical protein